MSFVTTLNYDVGQYIINFFVLDYGLHYKVVDTFGQLAKRYPL